MRRRTLRPRRNLAERARELGFSYHADNGRTYWDESVCYEFTLRQIENDLETPSSELAALCTELVDRIVGDEKILRRLHIPQFAWSLIFDSWKRRDLSLYGRFDLCYDGNSPAKLLEYNADTPTSLYEAAVFQWFWLQDAKLQKIVASGADQFNSIHERLIERWRKFSPGFVHLACMSRDDEDRLTVSYLEELARQAGKQTLRVDLADIGLRSDGRFVDRQGRLIEALFKLYPWEWMFADEFGKSKAMRDVRFVEPPWKALLSNKGILPLLWEMAPGHPNLLPAYFEDDPRKEELGAHFARKPLYSREGANVMLVDGSDVLERQEGSYGAEGFIRQALAPLPNFSGNHPVIGSWIVANEACGIGIREDTKLITSNTSRFVPHMIGG